ncbi:MAG: hypothetical protein ACRDP9_04260 [Kribbellaceae bacterium]
MNISAFADLLASRGLRLLPGSYAVPVDVLVELQDGTVAHFTARGTTITLALYAPSALQSLVIPPECGCGKHHEPVGPTRTALRAGAEPLVERTIDGELAFGWTGHEAGLLRLADAATHFFELLVRASDSEPALVGVA